MKTRGRVGGNGVGIIRRILPSRAAFVPPGSLSQLDFVITALDAVKKGSPESMGHQVTWRERAHLNADEYRIRLLPDPEADEQIGPRQRTREKGNQNRDHSRGENCDFSRQPTNNLCVCVYICICFPCIAPDAQNRPSCSMSGETTAFR
jgi:hypothetical protein